MFTMKLFAVVAVLQIIQHGYAAPITDDIHSFVYSIAVSNQANTPVSFRMDPATVPFIGRVSEISELKWAHIDKKMVVLTGARGVGKSELAKKYAQEIKVDNTTSTIWINSETHISIIDAFKDLGQTVGLSLENKDVVVIIKEVFNHFNNRKTLFIFDNAGDNNVLVNNLAFWIGKSKLISVIVTSRSENWDITKFKITKVNPFTVDESKEFIKRAIQKEINLSVDDSSCEKLAALLNHNPLALNGAVKDIIKENFLNPSKEYTINDFIESFNKEPIETVTTEVRHAAPDELEGDISSKINEEVKRVGDQITDEAKRFAHSIRDEGRRVRKKLKKIFG